MSDHVLQTALAHHRAGRLGDAEALYCSLLVDDPRNADALNLLGVLADAKGDSERGADLIAQAIAVRDFPRFRNNLGMVLGRLGRHQAALAAYAEALALWPAYPEALNNRGAALQALGRPEEAAASFRAAIGARPDYAEAWGNLGNTLRLLGKTEDAAVEAESAYRRQLELAPDDPVALSNLAATLKERQHDDEARELLSRAAALANGATSGFQNQSLWTR
jgi:tetratricopeptide (TPR) repeat protein